MLSGKKKGKIQIAKAREGVIVPAMRENPTPATGPVSIKHVRNTVPTALRETTAPAVSTTQAFSSFPSPESIPSNLQLEEPSL